MTYLICTGAAWWLSSYCFPHSKKVPSLIPGVKPYCLEFACSRHVCVGSLCLLWLPPSSKEMQIRSIGDSKLREGVHVGMNGCLSLLVSPAVNWRPVQGVPCPRRVSAGIGSSIPATLQSISGYR